MRVLDIDQNTEEWEEFRKGKSGGSAFGKMYKINGRSNSELKDQFSVMLAERVSRPMTPNDYMDEIPQGVAFSWAVRGHILEPKAADAFASKYNKTLSEGKIWVSNDTYDSYVSPDRSIVGPDGKIREAVEIKCLSSEKVLKVWWDKQHKEEGTSDFWIIPSNEYQAQAVKYFVVNEDLEKLYWVVYTDLIPWLELVVLDINRQDIADFIKSAGEIERLYLDRLDEAEKMLKNE
jgi:hypothetical protein